MPSSRIPRNRAAMDMLKAKVALVGEASVGKSSLVRRFVFDAFDDPPTPGATITRKEVTVRVAEQSVDVVLMINDVLGEPSLRDVLKDACFLEVQGVLAIGDLTRPGTLGPLPDWIRAARSVSGSVPVALLGNKTDLTEADGASGALCQLADTLGAPSWRTSAKTGENVESAFSGLSRAIVTEALRRQKKGAAPIEV